MENIVNELTQRIHRAKVIVEGLENYEPFKMMIEDFSKNVETIDNNWHLIPITQQDKLMELRVTKLAAVSILRIIESYKYDITRATKELAEIQNPDQVQASYYDKE